MFRNLVQRALDFGAIGYLHKGSDLDAIEAALLSPVDLQTGACSSAVCLLYKLRRIEFLAINALRYPPGCLS